MNRVALLTYSMLVCLPAAAMAGSDDAIYGRAQADGTFALTNVPDEAGYQLLVQGAGTAAAGRPLPSAPKPLALSPPLDLAPMTPVALDTPAAPPSEPQQTLPNRDSLQEAAAAAARVAAQPPEVKEAMAAAVANQAFQDMTAAGSASDRLRSLYQASQGAYATKRAQSGSGH